MLQGGKDMARTLLMCGRYAVLAARDNRYISLLHLLHLLYILYILYLVNPIFYTVLTY
jgi:hypothetical protein